MVLARLGGPSRTLAPPRGLRSGGGTRSRVGKWVCMVAFCDSRTGSHTWTTASIDVSVNGKTVLRSGGVMKITGGTATTFEYAGMTHKVALSWGKASLRSLPFRLEIDDDLVADSCVLISNWWLAFWPVAAILLLAFLWRTLGMR